ncbi:SMI1/KNR4 family protein [Lignipirellula cremea]|uniref:SMI1/KNR4 family protein n=1 Tax=Lignipirellula cremea TaxID=2528010 RepID=UPI0011A1F595
MDTPTFPPKHGFYAVFSPSRECDIQAAEESLGGRFPDDYRKFLAEWNGGVFLTPPADSPCAEKCHSLIARG